MSENTEHAMMERLAAAIERFYGGHMNSVFLTIADATDDVWSILQTETAEMDIPEFPPTSQAHANIIHYAIETILGKEPSDSICPQYRPITTFGNVKLFEDGSISQWDDILETHTCYKSIRQWERTNKQQITQKPKWNTIGNKCFPNEQLAKRIFIAKAVKHFTKTLLIHQAQ